MNLHHSDQRCVKVVSLSLFSVENIDGVSATRNGEDRLWRERERERGISDTTLYISAYRIAGNIGGN